MMTKLDKILDQVHMGHKLGQLAAATDENIADAKQQVKALFKEIVESSSRQATMAIDSPEICPTKVLLQKLEEL